MRSKMQQNLAVPFVKMHSNGNDFLIIDSREHKANVFTNVSMRTHISHRRFGVGCDQLLVMCPPKNKQSATFLRIYNLDGHESWACGNGTRCVAAFLAEDKVKPCIVKIETGAGTQTAEVFEDGRVLLHQGPVSLEWDKIPLSYPQDTQNVSLGIPGLPTGVAVNVGNPHIVFVVEKLEQIPLVDIGPVIETHALFPDRINVHLVEILDRSTVRQAIWERRVGLTLSCGTGAAAVAVALSLKNKADKKLKIFQPGGSLETEWDGSHTVRVTSYATRICAGVWFGEGAEYVR